METGPVIIDPLPTPLVYDDSIDTSNMTNVLLIDSILHDKQVFYDSANANTFPIIYDYNSITDDLLALLRQKFPASSIERISLVFNDRGPNIQARFMNNKIFFQENDLEVNQTSFSENVSFLISCIKEFRVSHIDFLACNTLQYSNWKSYYALLASETPVVVGASNNETGNINYGGDWVMESTGEDVMNIYFTTNISNYVSLLDSTITQNGGYLYFKMDSNNQYVQFSRNGTGWNDLTLSDWPVTIENVLPSAGNILRVVLTTDINLTAAYTGGINSYFIAESDYITFDGSGYTITIDTITGYLGFIQNGSSTATGFANVVVQNFTTTISGVSTLADYAGWLCQQYFGNGVLENEITNCTNTGEISGEGAGGIAGAGVGGGGGSATFTGCTNTGILSGNRVGGIAGEQSGQGGSVIFMDCANSGDFTSTGGNAGGIAGMQAGSSSGSVEFTNCTNIGDINGQSSGGIAGLQVGYNSGSADFTNCTNSGDINAINAGGIAGKEAGSEDGLVNFTNCFSTGAITSAAIYGGGIVASNAGLNNGLVTLTNCFSTGIINGQYSGGIAGWGFGFNTISNCIISECYSTGVISGNNAGGIVGANVGFTDNSLITPNVNITNSYSLGAIATTAGGICGGSEVISTYAVEPNITITNSYSYGALSDIGAGIVAVSLTSPTSQINLTENDIYVADGIWNDANAYASLADAPANINTGNPGLTWTSVETNIPYVLSVYSAQLYSPNSASSTSTYTTTQGLFQPGFTYSKINSSQVSNVLTTNVFASKGASPTYYSYNSNSFALTNTNINGSATTMTSSILDPTNGILEVIVPAPLIITANGSTQSVYLQMTGSIMEYSVGSVPGSYQPIASSDWPVTIVNSAAGSSTALRVVATTNLTISNTYGNIYGYFIAGSAYITFDGSGNTITMDTITSYPGFIQNGASSSNGKANVVVQNFTTTISGASTLASGSGWLCQSYFGAGVSGNTITGCANLSAGVISATNAGGIAGSNVGSGSGGVLTITNCTNAATISSTATSAGGIIGSQAASTSGLVSITNCFSTGDIIGQEAGGIAGSGFATNTSQNCIIGQCYSTGIIDGTNAGGIIGSQAASTSGLVSITKCFSTGDITGQEAGGIAGSKFATNTSRNCIIGQCYSTGNIGKTNAGGITGSNIGYNSSSLYTPVIDISNCYSLGEITSTTGGICGGLSGVVYSSPLPTIRITNSYSYGLIVSGGAGLVASSLTSSITLQTQNTYVAAGTWTDASANTSLANAPANINTGNPGITWTSVETNIPYVLSTYNAQLYSPNSVNATSTYTTAQGLIQPGFTYSKINSSQSTNVLTTNVFASKGTSPYYYSYNSNSFTLTNTNLNGSDTTMTSSILDPTNGILQVIVPAPPVPLVITANGSTQSVYLHMNGTRMEYSLVSSTGPWNIIYTYVWPVTIVNSTPGASTRLNVIVTENLTISNTYAEAKGYFIMGSQYITFDGLGKYININGITTGYPGFIQNSVSNVVVQNVITNASVSSVLDPSGGWLCQANFGINSTGNSITNCTNNGNVNANYGGGIAGAGAGTSGTLTFTNCTNIGLITALDGGGIAGSNCASYSGTATFTDCINNGDIGDVLLAAKQSGGIVGARAGNTNGIVSLSKCFNTGDMNTEYAGGIVGASFGYNTSATCTISACYSIGKILITGCGGIAGADIGRSDSAHIVNVLNCYSLGEIRGTCGGIIGNTQNAYSPLVDISINIINCYSYGKLYADGRGIVAMSSSPNIPPPPNIITLSCYVANENWTDASANAALTGTPTSISANNPGITWTSVETNIPYVLSTYNAQLYSPNSVSTTSTYTTAQGLIQPGFTYSKINSSQSANVLTTNVFASKVKVNSPYYYSYNSNSFELTNTNLNGSDTTMTSSILDPTNGILEVIVPDPPVPLTIDASGSTQSVYLRMSAGRIEYTLSLSAPISWNIIYTYVWPVTIRNLTPGASTRLNVIVIDDLTISSTYGNLNGYFIMGSQYITFDGAGKYININGITTGYPGFIKNSVSNVVVQNCTTYVIGSVLDPSGGWLCQANFGISSTGNSITNCTNNGVINGTTPSGDNTYTGGIAGRNAGKSGTLTFTNCRNNGIIEAWYGGGIAGADAGTSGILTFENCTNTGLIKAANVDNYYGAGGIVGDSAGKGPTSSLTFTECINTGRITASDAGGIAGSNCASYSGTATFSYCVNNGDIDGAGAKRNGGIAGSNCASYSGRATLTNCSNNGKIETTDSGGVVGWNACDTSGNVTLINCFNTGDINAGYAGGIVGSSFGYNTDGSCNISSCYSIGRIFGIGCGGIAGSDIGTSSLPHIVNVLNCYSLGDIGANCGGIIGNTQYSYYPLVDISINIINCYSYGKLIGNGEGIVAVSSSPNIPPPPIIEISNCYVANGSWTDASANAFLTGYPTDMLVNNPGFTWTSLGTNIPYVLSAYNSQLYLPNSDSTTSDYITLPGLYQPDFDYSIFKESQVSNVLTTFVFASKGTSPYYYAYNYNSFALTNTNANGSTTTMSSTIDPDNGIIIIKVPAPPGPLTIDASGSLQSIYLRMDDTATQIQYTLSLSAPVSWNTINPDNWPVTIKNSTLGSLTRLKVIFTENLTISNTYGNANGYFIAGSGYITFDGINYILNINNITNYSGFIDGSKRSNIIVQNIRTNINSSTLSPRSGWICRELFGENGINNSILNCTNNGRINSDSAGGIVGMRAGYDGTLSITNCTNTGNIIGQYSGGIAGRYAGTCISSTDISLNNVTLYVSDCTNTGLISGFAAGGIVGADAGQGRSPGILTNRAVSIFSNCTNTGNITGIESCGGIAGQNAGNKNSTNTIAGDIAPYGLTFINCNNSGSINSKYSGGIVGNNAGLEGSVKFENCTNTGTILVNTFGGGGIAGANANRCVFYNCANSGDIIGEEAGGIVGQNVLSDIDTSSNLCSNTGAIVGKYAGGIVGSNAAIDLSKCYSTGIISGQYAGGIAGAFFYGGISQLVGSRYINSCYSTGNITGTDAGGIVGADLGYNIDASINMLNCYSLGTIGTISGTKVGGIVGGKTESPRLLKIPSIYIDNCYSYGTISIDSSGIVSPNYVNVSNVYESYNYVANGNWTDASANASLAPGSTPTSIKINNPGTKWTTLSTEFIPRVPYVLSIFNAQLYNPDSADASSNYSTTPGAFQPDFNYSIVYTTQDDATIIPRVFASKGTTPYYYAYNFNRFTFTNVSQISGPILVAIAESTGVLTFTLPITIDPTIIQIPDPFTPYAESPNNKGEVIYTDSTYQIVPDISNNPTYILSTNISDSTFDVFQNSTTIPAAFIPNSLFISNNLISPSGIVKDSSGNFYVGSSSYNIISVYDNNGLYLRSISIYSSINIPLNSINYIAIDSLNNLYITGDTNSGVYVVPAGSATNNITSTLLKYTYGNDCRGVACYSNYLYIVIKRSPPSYIIKYNLTDNKYLYLNLSTTTDLTITTGQPLAIMYNNINPSFPPLYITTIDGSNNSIYTISDITGTETLIGGPGTATLAIETTFPNNQYPYSLTMDNSANLYVGLDIGRGTPTNVNSVGQIARVDFNGVISKTSYLTYNNLGIGRPEGLLFEENLYLYATDILHNRVIKSRPKTFVFGPAVLNADAFYVKDPAKPGEYTTYLYNVTNSIIDTSFDLAADCFQKGTKILCENDVYVSIENIKVGDLVKTYKHGYQKVVRCVTRRSQDYVSNSRNKIYTYTQKSNPELIEDLYLTGGHSLLLDALSETESNDMKQAEWLDCDFMVEDKYKLMCCFNKKLNVSANQKVELYRIALEPPENARPTHVYGIWANGILSESSSKESMNK